MPATIARVARNVLLTLALGILAAVLAAGALWISLPSVDGLAYRIPRTTAVIEQRRAEAHRAARPFRADMRPVRLDQVSPGLVDSVLLAEDAGFFGHGAFDWKEMRSAVEQDLRARRFVRGASTITQQLAKNLYLGTDKSLLRKGREALLAVKLERVLSKRRILALYLNVAEWGDGVFGIESAARARFGTTAANLDAAQAAVLAAMLPAPRRCDLSKPSRWLKRRSRRVLDRMREAGRLDPTAHAHASAALERILAGPAPAGDEGDEPPEE